MALLDDVKNVIRVSGTDSDVEILDLIEAAKNRFDIKRSTNR